MSLLQKDSNSWQLITFLLVGLIVGYGISQLAPSDAEGRQTVTVTPTEVEEETVKVVNANADDDAVLGDPDAPVTMIEFSDFQCPYCRRFYNQTLPALKTNYIDKGLVLFVYRDFPLASIHPDAQKAAEATECAEDQGKFWEMHDMIFDGQNELGDGTVEIPEESLKAYASTLGLDVETFIDCLDSGKYAEEVAADMEDGSSYGATATPTFFVNGQKIVGAQSYETFASVIDPLLE